MSLESFYGGKQGVSPVIKNRFKYINVDDEAYKDRINQETRLTYDEYLCLRDNKIEPYWSTKWEDLLEKDKQDENKTKPPLIEWTATKLKPFTMDECLKDVNYTDVWYGELCIIDTDSKYNPNNGKLYRRTLKQVDNKNAKTEDTAYAEYIGQIVGPMGGVSKFVFGSVDSARKMAVGELPTYSNDHVTDEEPLNIANWDYLYQNAENEISTTPPTGELGGSAARYDDIAILTSNNIIANEENLKNFSIKTVPGIELDENGIPKKEIVDGKEVPIYNDEIKYAWCNVVRKDDDKNLDAWVYMGFDIPYTVYESKAVNIPYWLNLDSVGYSKDTHDPKHPFYHNLHFYVPRGTRGIGPEEIMVVGEGFNSLPENTNLYPLGDIVYNSTTDEYSLKSNAQPVIPQTTQLKDDKHTEDSQKNSTSYWVAKWTLYNPKQVEGNVGLKDAPEEDPTAYETVYVYLGNYRDIHNISLDDDGTFSINYSDGTSKTYSKIITWVTGVSLNTTKENANYGQFQVTFNNDKIPKINENLHLIKNVNYDDSTGQITFTYSEQQDDNAEDIEVWDILTGNIVYPKQIDINTDKTNNNYGKVTYYNNTDFSNGNLKQGAQSKDIAILPLIKSNNYNPDTGIITFTYAGNPDMTVPTNNAIEYISVMKIDPNTGELQYKLNTDKVTDPWKNITDDADNNFILRDIVDLKISDGVVPASVYNLVNGTLDTTATNQTPYFGHLYVLYRGDDHYKDLGQVKVRPNIGSFLTIKNTNSDSTDSFASAADAIALLNNDGYIKDDMTYASNTGEIKFEGADQTGSFVIFTIGEGNNLETHLAYYDTISNPKQWKDAGTVGGSGSGGAASNIQSPNPSYNPAQSDSEEYLKWDNEVEITFKEVSSTNGSNPLILGQYSIWQ